LSWELRITINLVRSWHRHGNSALTAHATLGTLATYSATKGAMDTLVKRFAVASGNVESVSTRSFLGQRLLNCFSEKN
jgi:hypothetical protein